MTDLNQNNVYLVTGVVVAIDSEDSILIAGILSDTPLASSEAEATTSKKLLGNFAFTRRQAVFLRERLDEFLKDVEVKT